MKQYIRKIIITLMAIVCIIMSCPFYTYASNHGGSGGTDHNSAFITDVGTINVEDDGVVMYYIEYIISNIGAIFVDHEITKAMANDQTMKEYIAKGKYDANEKTVTFPKETVIYVKQCIDEYAKTENTKEENGGFYLLPTTKFDEVPVDHFKSSQAMRTFRNIVIEKGVLAVRTNYYSTLYFSDPFSDPDHPIGLVANISSLNNYIDNPESEVACDYFCFNCWKNHSQKIMKFPESGQIYTSCSEAEHVNTGASGYSSGARMNSKEGDSFNFTLYSTTGERIRVFVSQVAAQNYSVGSRKIYFSENYYTYEPEELTVAVDDLSKSVDDLQKVIDDLLEKISNDTSEKEIEELLRQILEELRKNPGTGGEGSGGGDVTVSVDLKETNSWLAKIYNRLGDVLDGMQEGFENVVDQLKKIKGWSIADTIIDGVDAVADWAQFIKDLLSDVTSGVATVSSTMTDAADLMKTKFPFCLPWDVAMLITFLAHEPQTPVFKLPIIIESFGIEEYIVVDMTRFSALSTLSRTLLTLLYCYGLVNLTFKVIPMVKEEN